MFNIFKKTKAIEEYNNKFEIELTASVLAYEVARSDGEIDHDEQVLLLKEIKKISNKANKDEHDIFNLIEVYSKNSVSFYEFIEDINKEFSKEDKISLIRFLWDVAYADSKLNIYEERLIRRVADLIKIKDMEVLKLKDRAKKKIY